MTTYHKGGKGEERTVLAGNQLRVVEEIWVIDNLLETGGKVGRRRRKVGPVDLRAVHHRG